VNIGREWVYSLCLRVYFRLLREGEFIMSKELLKKFTIRGLVSLAAIGLLAGCCNRW